MAFDRTLPRLYVPLMQWVHERFLAGRPAAILICRPCGATAMRLGTCKYSHTDDDGRGAGTEARCGNPAHEGGMCKFHLVGYLTESTAGEMCEMFWEEHDNTDAADLMDCSGYILPSLAQEDGPRTVKRRLRLDRAVLGLAGADFSGITFEQSISFKAASFKADVNFQACTFEQDADFSGAVFLGAARFDGSKFDKSARFSGATLGEATFDWSRLASAKFDLSTFKKPATFHECEFIGAADFGHAVFESKSYFTNSEFDTGVDFGGATFAGPMHFRGISAKCPAMVKFDGNVSNVSFLDTDIKEVAFGSRTTWSPLPDGGSGRAKARGRKQAAGGRSGYSVWNRKWHVYDEKIVEDEIFDPRLNHENLKSVYRDMRDNFDRKLAYNVSGGLFAREMEVERIYTNDVNGHIQKKHPLRRILTWHAAYNVLSEYGQSLGRPLLCLSVIFGSGTLLMWCSAGIPHDLESACEGSLADSAASSLTSMMPIPFSTSYTATEVGLKIASLPAVAAFLIALRRRFEKSRRH